MPVSRLRLRLAASFALALLLGLAVVDLGLFGFLSRQADDRLRQEVVGAAEGLRDAVEREHSEAPDSPVANAAKEALLEWPPGREALLIRAADGTELARRGSDTLLAIQPASAAIPTEGKTIDLPFDHEGDARLAISRDPTTGVTVLASRTTAALREDKEALALWLLLSVPLVLLFALPVGYLLAGRVLAPFRALASDIESMRPGQLDRRLAVSPVPDEIDHIAVEVNHLLDRLVTAQQQSQRFLAHAAHQLRTPLTLIRGESELAIERGRPAAEFEAALRRISQAAGQMSRRVDDLFLLVRAEAGERITARELVELDAVAIDAVDLMRGRAKALHRQLALGTIDGVEVSGEEGLLREAALELLENACRHAAPGAIEISVTAKNGSALLAVTSPGPVLPESSDGPGLGLSIVEWIATSHGGSLCHDHAGGQNRYTLTLPVRVPA